MADVHAGRHVNDEGIPVATSRGAVRFSLLEGNGKLRDAVANLESNLTLHLWSKRRWSMFQLLEILLEQTGKADVWLTSWTVTEEPIRRIAQLKAAGTIREFNALFDTRASVNNPNGVQMARKTANRIAFVPIHAKCMVLMGERSCVSVSTSANLTRNKRIEKYVLSTHEEVAHGDRKVIESELPNE